MPALVAGIHVLILDRQKTWMAGMNPARRMAAIAIGEALFT
jgi:hypothetical protein